MKNENRHNEEFIKAKRAEVVRFARALLKGEIGVIEGSRELRSLQFEVSDDDFDPDFMLFVAIDSETDHLPVGSVRANWTTEALKGKDLEIKKAEGFYRNQIAEIVEACKKLIVRFDNPA
jgi:hypothetical protein